LGGRKATIQFFKRLSGALDRVATCLADNNANTDRLLRDLLAEPLSVLLDHRAFVRLIGADLEFGLDELHSDERVMNERDGPMGSVWAELASRKHDAARSQPSHLLHRLFEVLNQPIRSYLDVERQNKGGAPGQPERKHVIERLVPIFSKLTGNEPTSTPNGAFMVLCELVLNGLGFETDGLEKAVQRILVQRHR
jgi:hypothetical protein